MHQLRQHALVGRQLHGTSSSSAPKRQTGQWSTRFCCRVTPKSRFQRLEICGKRNGHGRHRKCRGASENPRGIQSQWHADGSILHFTSILSVAAMGHGLCKRQSSLFPAPTCYSTLVMSTGSPRQYRYSSRARLASRTFQAGRRTGKIKGCSRVVP